MNGLSAEEQNYISFAIKITFSSQLKGAIQKGYCSPFITFVAEKTDVWSNEKFQILVSFMIILLNC